MNLILVAAISGFLAGEIVGSYVSENVAHGFEELYANGFYSVPPAPDLSLAYASLDQEEAYLSRLCRLPDDQRITTID